MLNLLPPIKAFYGKRAGFLSGGQQQMVSIGRTLLSQPRCLMMDEPSIGLAPKLFQDLLQPIRMLQREVNMAVILVEQNVREALKISDRVVVMKAGQVILDTVPEELVRQHAPDGAVLRRDRVAPLLRLGRRPPPRRISGRTRPPSSWPRR